MCPQIVAHFLCSPVLPMLKKKWRFKINLLLEIDISADSETEASEKLKAYVKEKYPDVVLIDGVVQNV